MNQYLKIHNGILQFNIDLLSFIPNAEPSRNKEKSLLLMPFIGSLGMIYSAIKYNDTTLLVIAVTLLLATLLYLLIPLLQSFDNSRITANLIPLIEVRSIVFERKIAGQLRGTIFLTGNRVRIFKCHKKYLEESGFTTFLKQQKIQVVLP